MTAIQHSISPTIAFQVTQNRPALKMEDSPKMEGENPDPGKLESKFHKLFQEIINEEGHQLMNALKHINLDGQGKFLSDNDIQDLFNLAEDFGEALDKDATKEEIEKITRKIQAFGLNGSFALAAVGHIFGMWYRPGDRKDIGDILAHVFLDHLAQEGVFQGKVLSSHPSQCREEMRELLKKKIPERRSVGSALINFFEEKFISFVSPQDAKFFREKLIESMRMPLSNAELAQNPKKFEKLWVNSFREMMTNARAQYESSCDVENIDKKNLKPILEAMKKNYIEPKGSMGSFIGYVEDRTKALNVSLKKLGYQNLIKDVNFNNLFQDCERYFQALDQRKEFKAKKIARHLQANYGLSGTFALAHIIARPMVYPNPEKEKNSGMGSYLRTIFYDHVARLWPDLSQGNVQKKLEEIAKDMGYKNFQDLEQEVDKQTENLTITSPDLDFKNTSVLNDDKNICIAIQMGSIFSRPAPELERNSPTRNYLKSA